MSAMMPESRKKRKNVISGAKTLKGKSEVKEGVAMKSLKNRVSQLLESYVTKQTPQDYIKEAVEKK